MPPSQPPVCKVDSKYTSFISRIPASAGFRNFDVIMDEGIMGDIFIRTNNDPNVTDIVVEKAQSFSHRSVESRFFNVDVVPFFPGDKRYTIRYLLDYTQEERHHQLYKRHQCAGVRLTIVFPQGFEVRRLNLQSRYKGNTDVQLARFPLMDQLSVMTAHGDITVNGVTAQEIDLKAPGGTIDAHINTYVSLDTFSSGDTIIDFQDWPFFADIKAESDKRVTVKYPFMGHFLMQSHNQPQVTGFNDTVVIVKRDDGHIMEGMLGTEWVNYLPIPRVHMKGYDTVLELKNPYSDELHTEEKLKGIMSNWIRN
ncbi:hypothetical protein BGZ94_004060 [Podila epigama]|nr:hypothetical protein BGZ94_004060 [Podila epigama]